MERNLFIKNIPKTKNELKEVMYIIGVNPWNDISIDNWAKHSNGNIFYNNAVDDYNYSDAVFKLSDLKNGNDLIEKDYLDIVNQNKTIGELKINECVKISDSYGNIYNVMRVENGYIYTNESNNMCFIPNNKILI